MIFAYVEPDHHGNWTMVSVGSSCSHTLSACISQTEVDMNLLTCVGGTWSERPLINIHVHLVDLILKVTKTFSKIKNHLYISRLGTSVNYDFGKLYVPTEDFVK